MSRIRRAWRRLRWPLVLGAGLTLLWQLLVWPDVTALGERHPETTAFIERYLDSGKELRRARRPVPYASISRHLKQAVLVGEDISFFDHSGFAWDELRAAWRQARERGEAPRGASTLTQQLAKNLWLSPSRNPWRKVKEAALTVQLERELDKRRILELYLNAVEFGPGIYGAEAGAQHFFGIPASDLSPAQAASLAAGLPASSWYPGCSSRRYANRVRIIRRRMANAGWLFQVM